MTWSLLFIPDITGFTKFVNDTEVAHGHHIVAELLELIIDSDQLGMTVSEVEGDAVLSIRHPAVLAPPISLDSRLAMEVGSREKGVEDVPEGWVVRSDRRSRRNSTGTVERSGEDGGGVAVIARRGSR